MSSIDKRDKLIEDPFTYKNVKDEKVLIYRGGKLIMTLTKNKAIQLLSKLEGQDDFNVQLILAKITGHYKHGNER
ncbi:MAG: hypothetical protein R2753_15810 [Chitinophagales bacterium]